MNGFDWLNMAGLASDSDLPPPPVSFGVTPTSSTSSLNLKAQGDAKKTTEQKQKSSEVPHETAEDLAVPLSLRADELTRDEAKTYLRWYNDIVVRRGTNLIRLDDVFQFLRNFNISQSSRELLNRIFREVNALNLGEFFAFLRVIAHVILGKTPMRRLIKQPAPIPKPKSILSAKRTKEEEEDEPNEPIISAAPKSYDLDSFTQMLLTGEGPQKKKKSNQKRIKFSDQVSVEPASPSREVEPVKIDMSLPMDQLLNQLPKRPQQPPQVQVNEEEELKEMQDTFSRFQNVRNVDSALIHGTPSNIPSIFFDEVNNASPPSPDPSLMRPLAPNHTGPVLPLAPSHTGPVRLLSPNRTDPAPFAHSLLQPNMTGPAQQNGYLSPNYTGVTEAIQPTLTGSVSPNRILTPPVPPQRRSRSVSSPIPYENHVTLEQLAQATLSQTTPSPEPTTATAPPPPAPTLQELQAQQALQRAASPNAPAPPPPRRRGLSQPPPPPPRQVSGPPLPPKVGIDNSLPQFGYAQQNGSAFGSASSSTQDILGDLKALQSEVDRLQYYGN